MNDRPMIALIILVCHVLGAVSCVHAIMTARTSQGAIAWAVSLISFPYLAAFSYLREVGQAGVKFYRYTDGFLHEKALLIDHAVATIGTANFDNRSFRLNFEITAVIADEPFAAQVERMFLDDFAKARLIYPAEAESKPWWFRFAVQLARLTAPIQ